MAAAEAEAPKLTVFVIRDPRINACQALEVAFLLAEQLMAERLSVARARPAF